MNFSEFILERHISDDKLAVWRLREESAASGINRSSCHGKPMEIAETEYVP